MHLAQGLLNKIETDASLTSRCKDLFAREFAVENTVKRVISALAATGDKSS